MKEAKRNWLGLGKHQKGSFFFLNFVVSLRALAC